MTAFVQAEKAPVVSGTVKWGQVTDDGRAYGFIVVPRVGDVYFDQESLRGSGITKLSTGEKVVLRVVDRPVRGGTAKASVDVQRAA
ncbi:MAG: hypothetical protein RLZZ283_47 [Candidatus Parcubacteria bacterium]|jgi:cold shock CspA family protein